MQDAPAPQDPLVGTIAGGRYRLLRVLGEGGMGRVYLAEHVAIQKQVALKVLRAEYADKGDVVTRFQQEAISASRIKHPNVLDVFDFGRLDDGSFYLAMEYLEGNDLAEEMRRRRSLDPTSSVRIALEICRALGAAHAKGVVHRDLKPENVFLQQTDDGGQVVKIVDFGIALLRNSDQIAVESRPRRLTKTGMIFGTPEYMAPEQAAGKHADQRADIYALGIMLYEMFTGAVPFTGETFLGVLVRHLNDPPPPMNAFSPDLAVSPQLQAIVFKALEKNPDERYQSMAEVARALTASPEGALLSRGAEPTPTAPRPAFVAPAVSNATAPEFGVVSKAATSPAAASRSPVTLAAASGDLGRRAETGFGAESAADAEPPAARRLLAPALGLLVLAGAGLAVLLPGRSVEPSGLSMKVPAAPSPSVVSPPTRSQTPLAEVVTPAAPTVSPAPASVKLTVETEPNGAILSKNGFQVCDATPCEVLTGPNETLELEAIKGSMRGERKVLAQRDQRVLIRLVGRSARPAAKPGPKLCEVDVDGLKILRPCN